MPHPVTVFHRACCPFPNDPSIPFDPRSIPFDGSDGLWRIIEIVVVTYDDGRNGARQPANLPTVLANLPVQALEEALRLARLADERHRRGRGRSEAAALQALEMLSTAPDDMGNMMIVIRLETDDISGMDISGILNHHENHHNTSQKYKTIAFKGWLDKPLSIEASRVMFYRKHPARHIVFPAGHARLDGLWWEGVSPEAALRDVVYHLLPPTLPREHSSLAVVMSNRVVDLLASGLGLVMPGPV
jgi:hypothetical protein